MAEYWMRSSSGTKASIASISELLPAAELDCTHHGQRRFEMPRHGGQIADQLVGLFAHHAAACRSLRGCGRAGRGSCSSSSAAARSSSLMAISGFFGSSALRICSSCSSSSFSSTRPRSCLTTSSFTPISIGGLLDERRALARRVEIERIDVEAVAARSQQIHLQQLVAEILREAAHAIAAVAQRDDDLSRDSSARRPVGYRRLKEERARWLLFLL